MILSMYVMTEAEINVDNERLVKIISDLLGAGELHFLKVLRKEDLEKLIASIRDRIDRPANGQ